MSIGLADPSSDGRTVRADVLNVIPPQRASAIARAAGVVTANDRWCDVDFGDLRIGQGEERPRPRRLDPARDRDAQVGHMANQHAKVCAAAVVALLSGPAPDPAPVLNNTCYSFITAGTSCASIGPPVRGGEENRLARARLGGIVIGDERARRPVRLQLGQEHLGRHADVDARNGTALAHARYRTWRA